MTTKYDNFVKAFIELMKTHEVVVYPSHYDTLQVFDSEGESYENFELDDRTSEDK